MIYCPHCETHQWSDFMVISNYYHIWYIPMFPTGKEVNTICRKCGLKRNGSSFNSKLISNYDEIKSIFKHPLYAYTGVGTMALLVIIAAIVAILQ